MGALVRPCNAQGVGLEGGGKVRSTGVDHVSCRLVTHREALISVVLVEGSVFTEVASFFKGSFPLILPNRLFCLPVSQDLIVFILLLR